jgi:hypothetical protein
MDIHSDSKLIDIIEILFGDWPILQNDWNDKSFDAMDALIKLRLLQIEPVIDVNTAFDPKNPRVLVLRV